MTDAAPTHAVERPLAHDIRLVAGSENRTHPAHAPNPNHPSRLVALDAARVIATFAVIWVHVVEVQQHSTHVAAIGRFGTSFYVISAVLLAYRTTLARPARGLLDGSLTRAKRLLVPFLLWSLIYGVFYAYHGFKQGMTLAGLTEWWGPFAGTARHLWFLPFAFATGAAVQYLVPRVERIPDQKLVRFVFISTLSAYAFFYGFVFFAINHDTLVAWHLHRLDRWIEEIPLAVFALGASAYFHRKSNRERRENAKKKGGFPYARQVTLLAIAVAIEVFYSLEIEDLRELTGAEGRYLANLVGLTLLAAALDLGENRVTKRLARVGKYTYFAFLSHVLLLDMSSIFFATLPGFGTVWFAIASSLTLFAVCLGISYAVRRVALLRWLSP